MQGGRRQQNDAGAKAGWESLWDWYRRLRQWLSLRPGDLTPADIVPPGALPICPSCVQPHHPAAARCPNCREIVSRYATSMGYVWILVWGPKLQRVVRQCRLSRLLCAGLLVSSIGFVANLLAVWVDLLSGVRTPWEPWWPLWAVALLTWVVLVVAYFGAACQMLEAAVQKWGTWRDEGDAEEEPTG
ncbi:MAG: hypothetical protein MUQ26_04645 [Armatimonadetes bacterium]|nr:hypothetical protein [Armatimonadota bacterium]